MSSYVVTWSKPSNVKFIEIFSGSQLIKKVGDVLNTIVSVGSGKTHDVAVIGIDDFGNRSNLSNTIQVSPTQVLEILVPTPANWLYTNLADISVDGEIVPSGAGAAWIYGGRVFNIPITQDFELECTIKEIGSNGNAAFGLTYGAYTGDYKYCPFAFLFSGNAVSVRKYAQLTFAESSTTSASAKYTIRCIGSVITYLIDDNLIYTDAEVVKSDLYCLFSFNGNNRGFENIKLNYI